MAEEGGLKKKLFDAGMANAEVRQQLAEQGKSSLVANLKHSFFDKLIFSKVRDRFGGRLRFALSGGAALSMEVGDFINKLGIFVCEGYGLTETSPIVSTNHPGARKLGSVGQPVPDVEVIIDTSVVENPDSKDGEIVVKGPNVMLGYHGLPAETAEVIREDGAFRTGDLGRVDEDGFLFITGRIKEQYKLENGKYVVPAPLEELLQLSPFISQAFIHGANKPYNIALIVPDKEALTKWAGNEELGGDYSALLEHEKTRQLFEAEVKTHSKAFKRYEQPRNFHLIAEEFSIDNGMLTPKMSLKRNVVLDHFQSELDGLHP
jgi:long-chain acyl-CoA synthetase